MRKATTVYGVGISLFDEDTLLPDMYTAYHALAQARKDCIENLCRTKTHCPLRNQDRILTCFATSSTA